MHPSLATLQALARAEVEGMGASLEMVHRVLAEAPEQRHPEDDTLIVALNYRCNSRCRFCIIETEIDQRLEDTNRTVFDAVFRANAVARQQGRGFRRLTISGAESTLIPDLPALVDAAVQQGAFEVVRLQTNARRLRDRAYTEALVAAGAREYFVSMHGPDAATDAHITRSPRSFPEMLAGLENLRQQGAAIVSNTVVSADNAARLPEVARLVAEQGVQAAHFWCFLHIGEVGQQDQLVSLRDAIPPLLQAVDALQERGVPVVLKWFPRCLLGRHGALLDNHQPQMLIRDEFQVRLSDGFVFGCPHARSCRHFGRGCDGLHEGQLRAFPGDAALLLPSP